MNPNHKMSTSDHHVEIRSDGNSSKSPPPKSQPQKQQKQQQQVSSSSSQHCLICYTPFVEPSNRQRQYGDATSLSNNASSTNAVSIAIGITPCSHNEICALCHLRLRQLHQDLSCPICKTTNEMIVVDYYIKSKNNNNTDKNSSNNNNDTSTTTGTTSNPSHPQSQQLLVVRKQKLYEEYPIWGNELGKEYILYEQHTFFPIQYYTSTIIPIIRYSCHISHCTFGQNGSSMMTDSQNTTTTTTVTTTTTTTTLRQLQDHLRVEHTLTLCPVCTDHQRDFVSRLPRYNPTGLRKHYQLQHYTCPFCSSSGGILPFYDLNALYLHCHRDHYRCHICETNLHISNEFYKNYKSLERHFDTQHYLCHHPSCLTDRFIVFYSDIDLAHHERTVHQVIQNGGSKIQLEFKFHKHGNNNNNHQDGHNHGNSDSRNGSNVNYNIDGTAFTPPALPSTSSNNNNNNNSSSSSQQRGGDSSSVALHPQHAARTEQLRQQAASLRHASGELRGNSSNNDLEHNVESNITASAFPSLQETVPNNNTNPDDSTNKNNLNAMNRLTIGWTADGTRAASLQRKPAGVVTEEDFPSLVTNSMSKAKTLLKMKKPPPSVSSNISSRDSVKNGNNWTVAASGVTAHPSRTVTPPIPLAYATMTTPSTSITTLKQPPQQQKQSNVDLSDKQSFPSLGVGNKSTMKKAVPYTAAQDFAASIRKSSTSTGTSLSLLSPLPKSSATTITSNKAIPDVSSVDNFPSLMSTNTKNMNGPGSSQKAKSIANVTGSSSTASTTLSIDAMKGILGPVGYKAMKTYTREFVNREMTADSYVDHMASLFPNGYTDIHFWNFVPELIRSFPTTADQDGAFAYMENLHRMKNGALNHEAHYHTSKSSSTVSTPHPPAKSSTSYATLASIHAPAQQQVSISSYTPTSTGASSKVDGKPKANSKNVWGGSSATSITNPTSSASTSSSQLAATSSTTQSTTLNNTNKKKSGGGKQKNELRALAFGL